MSNGLPEPQTKLAEVKRGDSWQGLGLITVKLNDAALDLTGASVLMQLRKRPVHGKTIAEWSTARGSIEMIDTANGQFKVVGRVMNVPAGSYAWDIEITLADGRVITIAQGTWRILQDVSR